MSKKEKYLAVMPIEGSSHRFPNIQPGEIIPAKSTIREVQYLGYRWFHMADLERVLDRALTRMDDDTLDHLKEREKELGFFPIKKFPTEPLKMNSEDFEKTSDN